jgi:hypothetical protein
MTPQEAVAAELKELEELLLVPDVRKSARLVELSLTSSWSSEVRDVSTPRMNLSLHSKRNGP